MKKNTNWIETINITLAISCLLITTMGYIWHTELYIASLYIPTTELTNGFRTWNVAKSMHIFMYLMITSNIFCIYYIIKKGVQHDNTNENDTNVQ